MTRFVFSARRAWPISISRGAASRRLPIEETLAKYREEKNGLSIDGIPGLGEYTNRGGAPTGG